MSGSAGESVGDSVPGHRYTAAFANEIEPGWQARWAEAGVERQADPGEPGFDGSKPKFYCLDMFPYPSGAGLHVGHPEGYTATDIISRYKRMNGFNVLHPMGWDAFGLPAEQYAIQTGVHPAETTKKAIDNFRRQLKRFGFGYDWSREFGTIDPDYYKWTQWIFLRLYHSWFDGDEPARKGAGDAGTVSESRGPGRARAIEELEKEFASGARAVRFNPRAAEVPSNLKRKTFGSWDSLDAGTRRDVVDSYRLAYLGEQTVNWCPKLGTALANEEVIDGRSERGGFPVLRKPLRQWMLRITAYADRLLRDLEGLDWPESTRTQQGEWIGRSEGAELDFALANPPMGLSASLRVYTTRPDTVFGATFMVVAPEHPLVEAAVADPPAGCDVSVLRAYVEAARNRADVDRQESKEKTGVDTGLRAVNPATGAEIPVWTADYVLMGYGFGAIMAVPAHDERDFAFAKKFGLGIRDVVYPTQIAAISYFCKHADAVPDDDGGEIPAWKRMLADFIGITVSQQADPPRFAEAFETVLRRRNEPNGEASDGSQRRGSIAGEWVEAIDVIGEPTLTGLRSRFAEARHYAASGEAYSGPGRLWNSSNDEVSLDGLAVAEAKARISDWLEVKGIGSRTVNYRLRDWLFSRQRYWGEPFPIVYDAAGRHHAVSDAALPVALPAMDDYQPEESDDPRPLLAKAQGWVRTTAGEAGVPGLDAGSEVVRETNTMPGWAGSCWYHLRYCGPTDDRHVAESAESYWLGADGGRPGVDLYVGGAEHAVLHLLYARFWHKVLFDLGHVSSNEPYRRLFHQGLILSNAFQRADKSLVPVDEVDEPQEGAFVERETGDPVKKIIAKMSKSLRNVINPDDVIAEYGADTFRLYEMYMGPLDQAKPWDTRAIEGMFRFLANVWRLCIDDESGAPRAAESADAEIEKKLHRAIDKVGSDIEKLAFNTAIAAMIELRNAAFDANKPTLTADQIERFSLMLAPFAPHLAEELWSRIGRFDAVGSVHLQAWPAVDPAMLKDDEVEVPVQIKGKVKARVMVPADADAETMEAIALADETVRALIAGKEIRKLIAVPGRMVNIVV